MKTVACLLMFALVATAQEVEETGKVDPARLTQAFKEADLVFTGKVGKVNPLGQTNSIPASVFGNVAFKEVKTLRGTMPAAPTFSYSYREGAASHMDLTPGTLVVVAVRQKAALAVVPTTDSNLALVKKALAKGE